MKLSTALKAAFFISGIGVGMTIASISLHSITCFKVAIILWIISYGVGKLKRLF